MGGPSAIRVEGVSKKYCKDLKRSMLYGLTDIVRNALGRPARSGVLRKSEFWALSDVSFEIKSGERLGVIGPNGSGKTTLLKLLNGIFWPDRGRIAIRGRVGALIEVGAGFHPLLTGRENIYLNGAILGMSRREVEAKFAAIVDFAGIGDFIDTPVKYYSSGMFVRLGFSVAAHCEPDILLIDEVLAVGDIGFQNRCYGKIAALKESGTTIVLVSHSMQGIKLVCDRVLFLTHGSIGALGGVEDTINIYCEQMSQNNGTPANRRPTDILTEKSPISIDSVVFTDPNGIAKELFNVGEPLNVCIRYVSEIGIEDISITCSIYSSDGILVSAQVSSWDSVPINIHKGAGKVMLEFEHLHLAPDSYMVSISVGDKEGVPKYARIYQAYKFRISGLRVHNAKCYLPHRWVV